MHTKIRFAFLLFILITVTSCSKKNYSNLPVYQFKSETGKPDYNNLDYWAAHSWKRDLSDSVPKGLLKNYQKDSLVDVFFIHPTTMLDKNDTRWNAPIDDPIINAKTDYSTILYQASVFNEKCRVFAPRYRQAHIKSFFIEQNLAATYFNIAYDDVKTAFEYYLKNLNNGRPIIIASHSQGTLHAARLLKEYFEGKTLYNKLVAAYIPGLPVAENYFKYLEPCKDSTSTGCFVTWRTFKSGYTEPYIAQEKFKAVVVNPITWTMDTTIVPYAKSKGGVLLNFNKIKPHLVKTQIHNNILWSSKPNIFGKFLYTQKNYHIGDYNLFYVDIKENIATRIGAFWK
jgi:hypothetical protein